MGEESSDIFNEKLKYIFWNLFKNNSNFEIVKLGSKLTPNQILDKSNLKLLTIEYYLFPLKFPRLSAPLEPGRIIFVLLPNYNLHG